MEYVSLACASPVVIYISCGFIGFMAIYDTPITGKLSVLVDQLLPPSDDFHKPPPGDPIQIISLSNGSKAIQFILPFPLFLPFDKIIGVFTGPSSTQLLLEVKARLFILSFSLSHSR